MSDGKLHWSSLKNIARSPAHYKYFLGVDYPVTPAMRFGSLVHAMTLGVTREFVVYPEARRGNAWKDFKAEHAGKEIVDQKEWSRAVDCAVAIKSTTEAAKLLVGLKEQKLEWEYAGRDCAGTIDITKDGIADLKLTEPHPDKFKWQAFKMMWPQQLWWYGESQPRYPERYSIIACAPKPPHIVQVYDLTQTTMDFAEKSVKLLLERLQHCEENDHWPGYFEGPMPLDPPFDTEEMSMVIDGEEIDV